MRKALLFIVVTSFVMGCGSGGPVPEEIVVDNSDATCVSEGKWTTTSSYPCLGEDFVYARVPAKSGGLISTTTWTTKIPKTGDYEVFIRWAGASPSDRATNALYQLKHADGLYKFQVNQTNSSLANTWVSIGTHRFKKNKNAELTLSNEGANHNVAGDATRWVYQE